MKKHLSSPVSDELLLRYLEGNLLESEFDAVENAIENSAELQSLVDDYLLMQIDMISIEKGQTAFFANEQNIPSLVAENEGTHPKIGFKAYAAAAIVLSCVCGIGVRMLLNRSTEQPSMMPASMDVMPMNPLSVEEDSVMREVDSVTFHNNDNIFDAKR